MLVGYTNTFFLQRGIYSKKKKLSITRLLKSRSYIGSYNNNDVFKSHQVVKIFLTENKNENLQ